jgi:beta-N-acetylhexosaminidase
MARRRAVNLPPFAAAIARRGSGGADGPVEVPPWSPNRASRPMSPRVWLGQLRGELGFRGIIISDSLTMGAVAGRYDAGEAAVRAFLAGADVLCFGADRGPAPKSSSTPCGA